MLNDTPTPSSSGRAMMLAKFSGSGSSTATSSVSSADRISGASTSATSSTRRKRQSRMTVIDTMAMTAAVRNALTMVWLVASIVTAAPPARARPGDLRARTRPSPWLLRASGVDTPACAPCPSGSSQSRATSGGMQLERHRFGAEHCAQPVELFRQEAGQRRVGREQQRHPGPSAACADRRRSRQGDDPSAALRAPDRSAPARSSPPGGSVPA